ncbi:MAG TPA: cytochrome c biogenesis protein CcsA [Casimicrobiaceae bacterium]|nr:cytochrome c biogenesis protein CcsA [Casimicrobiaceae bacterium]
MSILIHALAAALYAVAAWARWPGTRQSADSHAATLAWILPAALVVHAFALARSIATPQGLDLSLQNAVSLVAALCVLVTWATGFLRTLPASAAIVLPVATVAALLPAVFHNPHRFAYAGEPWAAAHIAVALLAYAFLLVAALTALLMTGLEKRLHRGLPAEAGDETPPLLTLERYLFRLIAAGFVLLTLTVVSGALFSEEVFGKPFTLTHKSLFSILAWLTFGALILGRWRFGWRGRKALHWIGAGTALLVLAYLGSKFVLEVLLGR